ncbi:DUF2238 domain-containing protein [Adhaeribacter aquaticus]|uniref:DUF2238 domain-containing protein n=1 Tax=Adhaeribacter aquaticus TaxID=299567 RepID=UPI0004156CF4|nr:DUF2238 domain-containing protein [Adhaeribacter aquaticus]
MAIKAETEQNFIYSQAVPLIPIYSVLFIVFWLYTGFTTSNFVNWSLENTLTIPFVILLYYMYRWHKFSSASVTFIFIFLLLHVYGSQYTYPENPFGYWLRDTFNLSRNHFDRIVHFCFGLLLAYPMFEIFNDKLRLQTWLAYLLPIQLILSLGALYELVEWIVADWFLPTHKGTSFLGIQGDLWDAQKDMGLGVLGALIILGITYLTRRSTT